MLKDKYFAAVRHSADGHDFIDHATRYCQPDHVRTKARVVDAQCGPAWAKDNPVVRVALFEVVEVVI